MSDLGKGVRGNGEEPHTGHPGEGNRDDETDDNHTGLVDGMMQHLATEEDRRSGFERGGWAMGAADNETRAFINQIYQRADAFLFGRRTYELFAGSLTISWTR